MAAAEEECGICLDALTKPVSLPCEHKFCGECLSKWSSKYDHRSDKSCPLCRKKIPPTKEMLSQLRALRRVIALGEKDGRCPHPDPIKGELQYMMMKSQLEELEDKFEGIDDTLDDGEEFVLLPDALARAAGTNDIKIVLDWLGPPPIDIEKLNARNPNKAERTLLHEAEFEGHTSLISILLQFGANVDPVSAFGGTPLSQACSYPRLEHVARLLLEWGAKKEDSMVATAAGSGNTKLARLLKSDLGGRRCEIFGMEKRIDLNGKTGVAEKYLPDKDRYKVVMERTEEAFLVSSHHLKRRDRTPLDCGYYLTFRGAGSNGENRIDHGFMFTSKEEMEAYQAATAAAEKERAEKVATEEAKAEEAAAALLAELDVEDARDSANNGKKKNGKKGKRK